jgi:hypothetical protein
MKKFVFLILLFFSILQNSFCQKTITGDKAISKILPDKPKFTREQICTKITNNNSFDWKNASDDIIFSAAFYSENLITIGIKKSSSIEKLSNNFKKEILKIISDNEKRNIDSNQEEYQNPSLDLMNVMDVEIYKESTLKLLRNNKNVDYITINNFENCTPIVSKRLIGNPCGGPGFGCDEYCKIDNLQEGRDFTKWNGGLVSWNLVDMNILKAWDINKADGKGITVAVIDAGFCDKQPFIQQSKFASGGSWLGRTITIKSTRPNKLNKPSKGVESPWNDCGHGTGLISVIGSPKNNEGQMVGIAYNCNIIGYYATQGVVIGGSGTAQPQKDRDGVIAALKEIYDNPNVKIISMSIGRPGNDQIHPEIREWLQKCTQKGKLIFAAAGTSFESTNDVGVIFPANSSYVHGVTGLKINGTICEKCHYGDQVDFSVVVEKDVNGHKRQPLCWAADNTKIPSEIGNSSVATAIMAGAAALVWSKYPTWTASQVLQRLKESCSSTDGETSSYGYRGLDLEKATR